MDLRQLKYITAIAEEGNITRASEKVFISQPALSQMLRKLEKTLGTPLFVRDGRNVSPTTAGRIYLNGARAILNIGEDLDRKIRKLETSPELVRLHVSRTLHPDIVRRILPSLQAAECGIRVDTGNNVALRYAELLRNGACDIVVTEAPSGKESDFLYVPIGGQRLFLAGPPEVDTSPGNAVRLILSEPGTPLRELADSALSRLKLRGELVYETNERDIALALVREKAGCTFILSDGKRPKEADVKLVDLPFCPVIGVMAVCAVGSPFRYFLRQPTTRGVRND